VLDLRSLTLREARREYLITRLVPISYDPAATCPTWLAFLEQIMGGDQALITFVQKSVGYSLTGDTREQVIFLLYGSGANGKSTFLNILLKLLGEYGRSTRTETLLAKRYEGIPNDIARLASARVVTAVESEGGRRLAEALVKQLTGGDAICARFLHREYFEFSATFKVWIACNHKPVIRGTDHAIWRRIRLVPFTVTIPDQAQDKTLTDKPSAEMPGILNWALEGCRLWQQEGLMSPHAVSRATNAYREEMDALGAFLRECCVQEGGASETAAQLYGEYTEWCKQSSEKAITKTAFGLALKERGLTAKVSGGARRWFGVRLRGLLDVDSDDEQAAPAGANTEIERLVDISNEI
jgi:putative DNA primase/helicase